MTISTTRRARATAAIGVLIVSAFGLTACGGGNDESSDHDGVYYAKHDGEARGSRGQVIDKLGGGDYLRITVKGDELTYEDVYCDKSLDEDETSVGKLDEDGGKVVWTKTGRWHGDDEISLVDGTISLDEETYSIKGSDEANTILADAC